jgi:hypothetical protein
MGYIADTRIGWVNQDLARAVRDHDGLALLPKLLINLRLNLGANSRGIHHPLEILKRHRPRLWNEPWVNVDFIRRLALLGMGGPNGAHNRQNERRPSSEKFHGGASRLCPIPPRL